MQFLVNISITVPEDVSAFEVESLVSAERERADELALAGSLLRLWRVPTRWANWGLWNAADETQLREILSSLPLWEFMEIQVHAVTPHPSDPRRSAERQEEDQ